MDANFGLVRKASSGDKSAEAHHSNLFFLDDHKVHTFVESYSDTTKSSKVPVYNITNS